MDMAMYLTSRVSKALERYLAQEGLTIDLAQLPIALNVSAQASFGEYSMPVMAWAGKQKLARPPLVIAEALAELLRASHDPAIAEITVTKPAISIFA